MAAKKTDAKPEPKHVVTTFRVTEEDWRWLKGQAMDRMLETGGKLDASAVLREVLAAHRKAQKASAKRRK